MGSRSSVSRNARTTWCMKYFNKVLPHRAKDEEVLHTLLCEFYETISTFTVFVHICVYWLDSSVYFDSYSTTVHICVILELIYYFCLFLEEQRRRVWHIVLCSIWWCRFWTRTFCWSSVFLSGPRNRCDIYSSSVPPCIRHWFESITFVSRTRMLLDIVCIHVVQMSLIIIIHCNRLT